MFYVAHRLFAAHDRRLGALVAGRLGAEVGYDQVFLPFCDTDEEDLQAEVKGRRLFELDLARLSHLDGMLAVLHGPSLDDGVCMEIGYATAVGVPVIVLTTDFQAYGLSERGPALVFPDPLVQAVATEIVRAGRLGSPPTGCSDRFRAFDERNQAQVRDAVDAAVRRLLGHARASRKRRAATVRTGDVAFCEPSPYQHGEAWERILAHLRASAWRVRQATRLRPHGDPVTATHRDWNALAGSGLLLADVNGPETPPGAALMIGASLATGRRVIAVHTAPSWTFAHGREPNWRNLMIQYSVDALLKDADALPGLFGR
ncbi:MAG: nucleoside 2-deoxyribosyltransferase [Egibacteraceae bacterium]